MSLYNTLLLAVDLSDEAKEVASKAKTLAETNDAQLHIVHVIEPISFAYSGDLPMDFSGIQEEIQKQAEERLSKLGVELNIPAPLQHVVLGRPEKEIHNLAETINADLIIVGSHGRHGFSLLLGSTANGVLHGSHCDVLAVRVGKGD